MPISHTPNRPDGNVVSFKTKGGGWLSMPRKEYVIKRKNGRTMRLRFHLMTALFFGAPLCLLISIVISAIITCYRVKCL